MKTKKREVLGVPKTPNRNLFFYDDVDSRKFMADALGRLSDRQRLSYVNWCCRRQGRFGAARAVATLAHRGTVYYPVVDAMSDMAQLTVMGGGGGADADVLLEELYRRVRRP